jgi:SAM-dependent methyltransferase
MDRHRTEFAVSMRTLQTYLPPAPARVLDCGGGPGRFAIELARLGYEVTLFDLSAGNLQLAQEKATEAGVHLAGYEQGTALDMARFADEAFDAVLLMGPLYHLLGEGDRQQALAECRRVLKSGGHLFAAFISRYALHRYVALHEPTWLLERSEPLESVLTTGTQAPSGDEGSSFVAYYARPDEVAPLLQKAGFSLIALLGVEGLVSLIEQGVNALSGEAWETWVDLNCRIAPDPSIHGCVEHLLAAAIKPRWRAVLRQIFGILAELDIEYKVVGGAALALHGVLVPVNDVDIETTPEGAYRFQSLFASQVLEPVRLCASETYRSHFGRFDFDGLIVEVMGDLCRRQGSQWVPTMTTTLSTVELDGVPIPVPWLEEETLAIIRRGRLERAAKCLPHCDHQRLMSLLCGEQATHVLPLRDSA